MAQLFTLLEVWNSLSSQTATQNVVTVCSLNCPTQVNPKPDDADLYAWSHHDTVFHTVPQLVLVLKLTWSLYGYISVSKAVDQIMRLVTVFQNQKIVEKCCLRESSVFCDKKSIFFIEKSDENETFILGKWNLYCGKRSAGQKSSNKLWGLLKHLLDPPASISTTHPGTNLGSRHKSSLGAEWFESWSEKEIQGCWLKRSSPWADSAA